MPEPWLPETAAAEKPRGPSHQQIVAQVAWQRQQEARTPRPAKKSPRAKVRKAQRQARRRQRS